MEKIQIMSRKEAIQNSFVENEDCVIISISNIEDRKPIFAVNSSIKDILYLWFDDDIDGDKMINVSDATSIVGFVEKWKNRVQKIIVHCEAGISRSAGVAGAIGKHLNGNDDFVFKNKKYVPNIKCYRIVLQHFLDYNNEKENKNEQSNNQ